MCLKSFATDSLGKSRQICLPALYTVLQLDMLEIDEGECSHEVPVHEQHLDEE